MRAHEALADVLRQRLTDGTYPPGSVFPSARLLSEAFGLSENTAWRASRVLACEGRVESPPGDGVTRVCVGVGQSAPNYKQELINTLRRRIEHRVYPPGTRMPKAEDLAQELNVGKTAVLLAVHELCEEGLLDCRGGRTFVNLNGSPVA